MRRLAVRAALAVLCLCWGRAALAEPLIVGSKAFTESVLLGEMAAQLLNHEGHAAAHRRELGGTRILWNALQRGDVDCYPEYTGTLRAEIFASQALVDDAQLGVALQTAGVWASSPLGFDNTYVLGMSKRDCASDITWIDCSREAWIMIWPIALSPPMSSISPTYIPPTPRSLITTCGRCRTIGDSFPSTRHC